MATSLAPGGIGSALDPKLYEDRSGHIVGASIVLIILPTVFVLLRLLSRWVARAGFWWDDYTVVLALVLAWGPSISNLLSTQHGFGKHIQVLPPNTVFIWFKYLYCFEFPYTLAMAAIKYSILLFQYRIFPIQQFRYALNTALVFVCAFTTACVLTSIFQCVPIRSFWENLGGKVGGHCISVQAYFLIAGAINTITDFLLLALPIPILWRLRTGKPQKLILTGIFIMGLGVCVVSIVRLVVLSRIDNNDIDITWNYIPVAIWTAAEPSIAVVSACIPSLRPLFVRIAWPSTHRPKPAYHNNSYSSSWRPGKQERSTSFNRLQDSADRGGDGNSPWATSRNDVAVSSGGGDETEVFDLEGEGEAVTPWNRIRAKTTVVLTVSERVDWKDDLF